MLYLSKLTMNDSTKFKNKTQLQTYHHWIADLVPDDYGEHKKRNLWRIDFVNGRKNLLVLSESPINRDAKLLKNNKVVTLQYDSFLNSIKANGTYRFRLVAQPTVCKSTPETEKKKIVPLLTPEDRIKWLERKGKLNGYELCYNSDIALVNQSYDTPILHHRDLARTKITRVTFEGLLKVTDKDKFVEALKKGIGKGKAYGMGLLTVVPVSVS